MDSHKKTADELERLARLADRALGILNEQGIERDLAAELCASIASANQRLADRPTPEMVFAGGSLATYQQAVGRTAPA